jgi:hypothetical protein
MNFNYLQSYATKKPKSNLFYKKPPELIRSFASQEDYIFYRQHKESTSHTNYVLL